MKARIRIKVIAGASTTRFAGRYGDAWKLRVAAPPVDGKANEAITHHFAALTGVRAAAIRIVTGHSSALKLIEIDGIDSIHLERAILESHGSESYPGSSSPPKP